MDRDLLLTAHPVVYHMADDGTWPSIASHGLMSTRALVNLFDPPEDIRRSLLEQVRRTSTTLNHPSYGTVVVRDQGPLKFLDRCLTTGTTPQDFLNELNGRVFFWLSRDRLERLLNGRRYRSRPQTVIHVDTGRLLRVYGDRVQLAPYNTGSMHVPTAPKRGADVFVDLDSYPYESWRKKRGPRQDAVVELTVPDAVPDIADLVVRVERWVAGRPTEVLYPVS